MFLAKESKLPSWQDYLVDYPFNNSIHSRYCSVSRLPNSEFCCFQQHSLLAIPFTSHYFPPFSYNLLYFLYWFFFFKQQICSFLSAPSVGRQPEVQPGHKVAVLQLRGGHLHRLPRPQVPVQRKLWAPQQVKMFSLHFFPSLMYLFWRLLEDGWHWDLRVMIQLQ